MKVIEDKWEKTLNLLKSELTPVSFDTWICPLKPLNILEKKKILKLSSDSEMAISILETRYMPLLEKVVEEAFGQKLKIEFIFKDDKQEEDDDEYDMPVLTDELYLNPKYIFETFVVGGNNRFAHAASLAVSESPSTVYNPLFLYGDSGLGKTHLMHAIGHYILRQDPSKKVLYVSSEMFTNELIKAITEHKNIEFRNKYRKIDVLLIDDIQFLEKKVSTQEEFFHTFNTLYDANKQIIISSDRPPKEIATLEKRLRSRFEMGLIADIQPPDYETRVAILRNKAELEGLEVNNQILDVINIIAENIHSNIRELEGAFIRVVAYANLTNSKITSELAKEVLKDVFTDQEEDIDPEIIRKKVCDYYNIKISDIDSKSKKAEIALPRQIAMYLCRELTDFSFPKIAEFFSKKDHTTVIHAYKKISGEMKINKNLDKAISDIKYSIKTR